MLGLGRHPSLEHGHTTCGCWVIASANQLSIVSGILSSTNTVIAVTHSPVTCVASITPQSWLYPSTATRLSQHPTSERPKFTHVWDHADGSTFWDFRVYLKSWNYLYRIIVFVTVCLEKVYVVFWCNTTHTVMQLPSVSVWKTSKRSHCRISEVVRHGASLRILTQSFWHWPCKYVSIPMPIVVPSCQIALDVPFSYSNRTETDTTPDSDPVWWTRLHAQMSESSCEKRTVS